MSLRVVVQRAILKEKWLQAPPNSRFLFAPTHSKEGAMLHSAEIWTAEVRYRSIIHKRTHNHDDISEHTDTVGPIRRFRSKTKAAE